MKMKKAVLNIISASTSQILTIAVAFFLPMLYITNYGSEVNGLLSSVGQLFGYFALLEAGVGTATEQALYKYVTNDNTRKMNSILSATNYFYMRTGAYYFLLVVIVAFVYPIIVPSGLDFWLIVGTIILMGSGSVVNFWFQGKYKVLMTAEGKGYINHNVSMVATTFTNVIKIVLLMCGFNILVIQIGYLVVSGAQAIYYTLYIKTKYKWIDLSVEPAFDEISQSKNVLVHQITSLVFNNTDVLILTFVTRDLNLVSIYSIYALVYNNIDNITAMVNSAYQSLLGQKYYEDRKKFEQIFECSETFYMAFSFAIYFVAFLMTPWFINLYTHNADISYVSVWIPVLFVVMKLLAQLRRPLMGIINIAGDFKNTQGRTIIEMSLNLGCSLILVWKFSIYGVLIGTIIALIYRCIDVLIYVPKHLINHSPLTTLRRWLSYSVIFILGYAIWSFISIPMDSVLMFIVYGLVLAIISLVVFIGCGALTNPKQAKDLLNMIKQKNRG